MKKVLFTATVDSHIKQFHIPYLKLFKEKGYEVHVATNGMEEIKYCDKKNMVSFERNPIKLNNLKAIKQLKKIIEKEKFDIIHCHTPMGGVVTRIAAIKARKKYGTRVIYTAHGFHFFKGAPILNWIIYYPIEKLCSRWTDTLITINSEDYDLAKKKFKKCKDIQYIPGVGIDTNKFDIYVPEEQKQEFKKSLRLKNDDFILTCIARLDKNKNQEFLIEVIEQLINENKNIHLLLVGNDEMGKYYQDIVNRKKLNTNIHFLGRREDIPMILSITNIVVSASLREGLPVNIMEAFAARLPVIALNCRGMSDLITNGENGYIIDINNSCKFELYIELILKLYNNNDLKRIIANNNINKINKFSINNIIKLYNRVYFTNND